MLEPHSACSRTEVSARSTAGDKGDPVTSPYQAEGSDLRNRGEWRQVGAQGIIGSSSLSTLASQVPLQSICEALELERQGHDEVVDDPPVPPRSGQLIPCVMTTSMKKKNVLYCCR